MNSFVTQRVSWSETGRMWVLVNASLADVVQRETLLLSYLESAFESLSYKDRSRFERYRRTEKKVQFLLSRLAIAYVLEKEYGSDHRLIWDSRTDGCPVLLDPTGVKIASVSMSHSQNVFVIGLDSPEYRVGVDCEVIEHVSPASVFGFLGKGIPNVVRNADEQTQRWEAAFLWSAFEAEWKALQCGNTLEESAIRSEFVMRLGSNPSFGVPRLDSQLRCLGWKLLSKQSSENEALDESVRSLCLYGPDASISVASNSWCRGHFPTDVEEALPTVSFA